MNNLIATKSLCNAICNTFYPDVNALRITLFNAGIDPDVEAMPKDANVFKCAVRLVKGYIEGSRSEGGISLSVRSEEAIKQSIRIWCGEYGIDADEVLGDSVTVIDNITDLW